MAKTPQYSIKINPARTKMIAKHPIPSVIKGGSSKVALSDTGKAFLAARAGHKPTYSPYFHGGNSPAQNKYPIIGGQPQFRATNVGSLFAKSGSGATRTGSRSTGGTKVAADPMTRIVNRMIAGMLSPKQQNQQINDYINAALKAQRFETNTAYDREAKAMAAQAAKAKQYAMALGSMRDMSGLQTEADYTNAARNIQGLGTGLTGTVADAQQAEANQAAQSIAAATGGLGQAQGLDVAGLKNLSQYTGVTMPARDLFSEAANQAGEARWNQDIRGQQVMNLAQDYLTKGGTVEKERADKLAEIAATRPSLYQTALQNAQSSGNQNMATIISALALQNTASKTPSEIAGNEADTAATISKVTGFVYDPKTGKQKVDKAGNPALAAGYWLPPGTLTPQKVPSNQHVSKDGTKLLPNKTATSDATIAKNKADRLAKQGFAPDGKTLLNSDWYWGADGKPAKVPTGMMRDPKDPTNHAVIDNPSVGGKGTGPGGETPAHRTARIQGMITTWTGNIKDDFFTPTSPYVKDVADPYEVQKGWAKSKWVPKRSYAWAFNDIASGLPPEIRKNPQMIAIINSQLRAGGYKIPARTTTAGKGKGKGTGKTTSKDWGAAGRGKAPGQAD